MQCGLTGQLFTLMMKMLAFSAGHSAVAWANPAARSSAFALVAPSFNG
jgi:hypothetical protein